jgi:hypothetical protein
MANKVQYKEKENTVNYLINRKVTVRKMTKNWSGTKAFTDAIQVLYVPVDSRTGSLRYVFDTEEEREFFEEALGLPEKSLVKNSEYWKVNGASIKGEEIVLDLSMPEHVIEYKILLANKRLVAPSLDAYAANPTAQYCIIEEAAEAKKVNDSRKVKKEAYTLFAKMSFAEQLNYLVATGRRPNSTAPEIIEKAVGDDVENNPQFFINVITNPKYEGFILLERALQEGILRKSGPAIFYNQDMIGKDREAAVDYLFDKGNQEILLIVKGEIDRKVLSK